MCNGSGTALHCSVPHRTCALSCPCHSSKGGDRGRVGRTEGRGEESGLALSRSVPSTLLARMRYDTGDVWVVRAVRGMITLSRTC